MDPNIEDEETSRAGAAARETCDVGTVHGTYLGANDGTVTGGLTRARSLPQILLEELYSFVGEGWEQEDDITLLTLKRSAPLSGTSEKAIQAK